MTALRLAVLGNPVAHSLSPVIHRAALEFAGLEGSYVRRQVDGEGFEGVVAELRDGRLHGVNVTMPHKALAARKADRRSALVERGGGANTLWMEAGSLHAHTTDPEGVRFAWRQAALPDDVPVLLLGAGGAAAAALLALEGRECMVSARREEAARSLIAALGSHAAVVRWGRPAPGAVVVNATPLGMGGEPLPPGVVEEASGLLEMTYGGGETPAAAALRSRDRPVASGELMLVGQGAASFAIWTGIEVPPAVMLAALEARGGAPGGSHR